MAHRQAMMVFWTLLLILPLLLSIAFGPKPVPGATDYPSSYAPVYTTNYYQ